MGNDYTIRLCPDFVIRLWQQFAAYISGAAQRTEKFIDDVTLRSAQLAEAVLENLPESEADGRSDGIDPGGSKVSDDGQMPGDGQMSTPPVQTLKNKEVSSAVPFVPSAVPRRISK